MLLVGVRKVWQCWRWGGDPGSRARKENRQLDGSQVAYEIRFSAWFIKRLGSWLLTRMPASVTRSSTSRPRRYPAFSILRWVFTASDLLFKSATSTQKEPTNFTWKREHGSESTSIRTLAGSCGSLGIILNLVASSTCLGTSHGFTSPSLNGSSRFLVTV